MTGNRRWTDDENHTLKEFFPSIASPKLAEALGGRSVRAVNDQAYRLGLRKTPERLVEMGRELKAKRGTKEEG